MVRANAMRIICKQITKFLSHYVRGAADSKTANFRQTTTNFELCCTYKVYTGSGKCSYAHFYIGITFIQGENTMRVFKTLNCQHCQC
jgi:hypothetical protein